MVSTISATLGRDGRARIDLNGPTDQTLAGTWTREANDLVSLRIPELAGRRLDANGRMLIEGDRLARFELIAGTPGARSSAVMTFVADGYQPPREEMLCHQEARAQLEDERGAGDAVPPTGAIERLEQPREARRRRFRPGRPGAVHLHLRRRPARGQVLDATLRRR